MNATCHKNCNILITDTKYIKETKTIPYKV